MKIVFAFVVLFLTSTSLWAQKLIILHTNDHHGHFMPDQQGHYGLAAQATLVQSIRKKAAREGASVLVLSAGDINTGAPESDMFRARPDIEAMNHIGYDALVLGNHEFDISPEELRTQQSLANFEFLAANIRKDDGSEAFTPYIIKDIQGKKVAIVGFSTAETPHMSSELNRPNLKWEDPLTSQRTLIKRLKKEADVVIALSHLGYVPKEKPGAKFPGDEALAKANPEIDVIIGGHSHTELPEGKIVGTTSIFQAKESGQFLGQVEIDLSGKVPKVTSAKLIPVKNISPDPKVEAIFRPYLARVGGQLNERVGHIKGALPGGRGHLKSNDTPLANMLAEANKKAAKADIGIANGRGLRTGISAGDVTRRSLLSVSPFSNTVTYVDLNGRELWKLMELLHEKYLLAPDQNVSFSRGFELHTVNDILTEIKLNGITVERTSPEKIRIALGNFLSEMVTDFEFIKEHETFVNSGKTEVDAMADYLRAHERLDVNKLKYSSIRKKSLGDDCGRYLRPAR